MNFYKDEMVRTVPPEKCEACEKLLECQPFQDNRHELYRDFAIIPAEFGQTVYVCKKCMKSCFSSETLYRITDPQGKSRLSFVTTSVRCHSCGKKWHRKEKEVTKIPIKE